MAISAISAIEAGVTAIFNTLKDSKQRHTNVTSALYSLHEILPVLTKIYTPDLSVTLTDTTDAGVAEAIAADGELGLAWAAAHPQDTTFPIGKQFKTVSTTPDFTDNALATAKGGAVGANDVFQVSGADAVIYLGVALPDFSDDEVADF